MAGESPALAVAREHSWTGRGRGALPRHAPVDRDVARSRRRGRRNEENATASKPRETRRKWLAITTRSRDGTSHVRERARIEYRSRRPASSSASRKPSRTWRTRGPLVSRACTTLSEHGGARSLSRSPWAGHRTPEDMHGRPPRSPAGARGAPAARRAPRSRARLPPLGGRELPWFGYGVHGSGEARCGRQRSQAPLIRCSRARGAREPHHQEPAANPTRASAS